MSSTNKTSNYELSQFLGTDKPAWLSDYNTDMSKIDTQMKANADAATAAGSSASSASSAVGTLSNLTTDAKTSAVAAINEVDSHADSASSTASSALSSASAANTKADNLASYFAMTSVTKYNTPSNYQITSGGGSVYSAELSVARNSDGTLCKIYGAITLTNTNTSGNSSVKLNIDTGIHPSEAITITGCGITQADNGSGLGTIATGTAITINPNGTLVFQGYHSQGTTLYIRMFNGLIFVENFGDQPE